MRFTDKDIEKIMQSDLFCTADRTSVLAMLDNTDCRILSFEDGEVIHSPETNEKTAGLMLKGKAVVNTPDPAKRTLLRFLDRGELFGIANLFCEERYVSVIRSHGSSRVLLLPEDAIQRLLETDRAFLNRYLAFLSGRICYLNRKIGYLSAGSAERRLAVYLSSIGEREFRLPIPISSLSELLDVGRASLYRAFDRLEADGFLIKNGRNFILPDPETMLKMYQ